MDSDLVDIARKFELKRNTPLSGCLDAPTNFSSQSVRKFLSGGNISIIRMLDVDINANETVEFVVAGTFCVYLSSPDK
jgi:hypothetical protein